MVGAVPSLTVMPSGWSTANAGGRFWTAVSTQVLKLKALPVVRRGAPQAAEADVLAYMRPPA